MEKKLPINLDIDFCEGCIYPMTDRCSECIRMHLNESQAYSEDYRDKWSNDEDDEEEDEW